MVSTDPRIASPGDEEPFKVRKRDGDEGGEVPLKVVPSAGPARRACRDARVVLRLKGPNP